jgi:hypothetical protein
MRGGVVFRLVLLHLLCSRADEVELRSSCTGASCIEVSIRLAGDAGSEQVRIGAEGDCGVIAHSSTVPKAGNVYSMKVWPECTHVWVYFSNDGTGRNIRVSEVQWGPLADVLRCSSIGVTQPDPIAGTWSPTNSAWGDWACGWDGERLAGENHRCQAVRNGDWAWTYVYYVQVCPSAVPPPPPPKEYRYLKQYCSEDCEGVGPFSSGRRLQEEHEAAGKLTDEQRARIRVRLDAHLQSGLSTDAAHAKVREENDELVANGTGY